MSESRAHATDNHDLSNAVEAEGVSSTQLFGVMFFTVVAIAIAVFVAYFFWFLPVRDSAVADAENVPAERYVDQRQLATEAEQMLTHYAVGDTEGTYTKPIEAVMNDMVAASTSGDGEPMPTNPVEYNMSWLATGVPAATINLFSGADEAVADSANTVAEETIGEPVAEEVHEEAETTTGH